MFDVIDYLYVYFAEKTSRILLMDAVFLIQFANSVVLKFKRVNVQMRVAMYTINAPWILKIW